MADPEGTRRSSPGDRTAGGHFWVRRQIVALAACVAGLPVATPVRPASLELLSVSIRARFGERSIIGAQQSEQFKEYDAMATMGLPWQWHPTSKWTLGTRLMASGGMISGGGNTALITSLVPALSFGRRDGLFSADGGAGVGLMSSHRFGIQNFGGALQFALTLGIGTRLTRHFRMGYRYLHYSDAAIHGKYTTGADFHMAELSYWF